MLTVPTMEKLQALKLDAMAAAWIAQQQQADLTALAFERFGLLVEAEWGARENKRLVRLFKLLSNGIRIEGMGERDDESSGEIGDGALMLIERGATTGMPRPGGGDDR
jgi:hypothetical protein